MRFNGNVNAKLRMRVCEMKSEWLMLISWLCVAQAADGYSARAVCLRRVRAKHEFLYTRHSRTHASSMDACIMPAHKLRADDGAAGKGCGMGNKK